jgi:DNA-binding transcriptional LysR family regulator
VDQISDQAHAYRQQLTGHLRISIVSTAKYIMPYFLSGFMKQHTAVNLTMDVTNKAKVIRTLEQNEVDFSLVSILPGNLKLNKIDLLENKLYLVGNPEVKVRKAAPMKELLEQAPIILRESGSGTRQTMERFLGKDQLLIKKKIELTSNEAVKQAVIAGLGISIMPLIGIRDEITSGALRIIPVKGLPIKTTWRLIWLKEKQFSPVAKAFLKYVQEAKEEVLNKYFHNV